MEVVSDPTLLAWTLKLQQSRAGERRAGAVSLRFRRALTIMRGINQLE
jgi:hypothetical protein